VNVLGEDMSVAPSGVDRTVLLDFFVTFARCEFALKTGGFAKCGEKRGVGCEAQADWGAFIKAVSISFQSGVEPNVEAACERLIDALPWELVLVNGNVMWQQQSSSAKKDLATDALTVVRRLRNNLFHGNESGTLHGYVASQRGQRLRDAVLILQTSVSLIPKAMAAYNSAAL
jgi:hypothetical protein